MNRAWLTIFKNLDWRNRPMKADLICCRIEVLSCHLPFTKANKTRHIQKQLAAVFIFVFYMLVSRRGKENDCENMWVQLHHTLNLGGYSFIFSQKMTEFHSQKDFWGRTSLYVYAVRSWHVCNCMTFMTYNHDIVYNDHTFHDWSWNLSVPW